MTWLEPAPGAATPLEGLLGLRPELLARYKAFYGQLWDARLLPARLLELCRVRIAGRHGCRAEAAIRHAAAGLSDAERAAAWAGEAPASASPAERRALALADRVALDVHALTDAEAEAVRADLGDAGFVALLLATALFDANARLRGVFELASEPADVAQPASARGPLY